MTSNHPLSTCPDVASADAAYAWCMDLATSHYENFPVASVLLPPHMRRHISAVYAFSRVGDDIGDEPWTTSVDERIAGLAGMDALANAAAAGPVDTGNAILVALSHTIRTCALPVDPLHALIAAFRQDVLFTTLQTWDDVDAYCMNSADPVGELVLRISGSWTPEAGVASDAICTGLQLVNFWQDISVDRPRGRDYLPATLLKDVGDAEALRQAFQRTRDFFVSGASVVDHVRSLRLRLELKTIIAGGMAMLDRCVKMDTDLFHARPALGTGDYLRILGRVITGRWRPRYR